MAQPNTRATPKRSSSARKQSKRGSTNKPPARKSASKSRPSAKTAKSKAENAGQTVSKAASRAKVPLIASGAALAGAAGGLALASRQDRHRRLAMAMRKPRIKLTSRDVARAAKEVGHFSSQMGELASELQRARETNGSKHRSPVEVVLDGLTARR
jgi:hypothetical protein